MRRLSVAAAGFAVAAVATGAGPLPAPQDRQQPVFRARADLVPVYVSVTNAEGAPVLDLTADDFTVFDRKVPQRIEVFEAVHHEEAATTPEFALPSAVPRDVAANTAAASDRLVVIVVDDLHLFDGLDDRTKDLARQFVDRLGDRTSMAVLFTSGAHNTTVTDDRGLLLRAIETLRGRKKVRRPVEWHDPESLGLNGEQDPDVILSKVNASQQHSLLDFGDNLTTYSALQQAARLLMADDGRRKAFVFLSEGAGRDFPWLEGMRTPCDASASPCFLDHAVIDMMTAMHRANIATYIVDPRGFVADKDLIRECSPSPPGVLGDDPCFVGLTHWASEVRMAQRGLESIAEVSGGFAVTNSDDFAGGVNRIMSDLDNYYLLGFHPADADRGGYRELSVQIDRPGVTMRFRRGYETGPVDAPAFKSKKPVDDVTRLALGVLPARDLSLRLFAAPFPGESRGRPGTRVAVTIEVTEPLGDLVGADKTVKDEVKYTLLVAQARSGKVVRQLVNTAKVSSEKAVGGGALPDLAYQMPMSLVLLPGAYQLRASALSAVLQRGGSVFLDLVVPDYSKARLAVSGLAVGYADKPRVQSARALTPVDVLPFPPSLDRQFQTADTIRVFGKVAGRAGTGSVAATVDLLDWQGRTARSVAAAADAGGRVDVRLPLADLTPGAYELRMTVASGRDTANEAVGITIVKPSR